MDELLAALSDGLAAERRKRTRWVVPAVALGLVGVAAVVVALVRRREPLPLPPPSVETVAAAAPAPLTRTPAPAPLVAPAADVPRETPAPRPHPTRREKVSPRPRSVAMLHEDDADAAPAPPANGWLKLIPQGLGFADVYVDDQARGRVPRQDPLELPAGSHRIRLERSGKILEQRTVTVLGGATIPVPVRLDAQ